MNHHHRRRRRRRGRRRRSLIDGSIEIGLVRGRRHCVRVCLFVCECVIRFSLPFFFFVFVIFFLSSLV